MTSPSDFKKVALETFHFQYQYVDVYRKFCQLLNVNPKDVSAIKDIPFLPIQFFKSEIVIAAPVSAQKTFTSSGTTGSVTSQHQVADLTYYETSFLKTFEQFYGSPNHYTFLALLPSYLERDDSSLIYMVAKLIANSNNPDSGFYLNNLGALSEKLKKLEA
ncbi:MAG: acyl transferase, partial [Flavobacteriaceae bacterium]|nr:acyl transferase [Flavobacteriaceae bacterium]